jgi:hypothetical protein
MISNTNGTLENMPPVSCDGTLQLERQGAGGFVFTQ